jgi:hypothetical protein
MFVPEKLKCHIRLLYKVLKVNKLLEKLLIRVRKCCTAVERQLPVQFFLTNWSGNKSLKKQQFSYTLSTPNILINYITILVL